MVKTRTSSVYRDEKDSSDDSMDQTRYDSVRDHEEATKLSSSDSKKRSNQERTVEIPFFGSKTQRGACKYTAQCPHCKHLAPFANVQEWRDHHETTHHQSDGYRCPECDGNSQNWYNYTNHVQTHSSIPPAWNCIIDGCNSPFANIYSLLSHWKRNHKQYVIREVECCTVFHSVSLYLNE